MLKSKGTEHVHSYVVGYSYVQINITKAGSWHIFAALSAVYN